MGFIGHVDGKIIWQSGLEPKTHTGQRVTLPEHLREVPRGTILSDYEVVGSEVVLKTRTLDAKSLKIALVCPALDAPCGISTYSKFLTTELRKLVKEVQVFEEGVLWKRGESLSQLAKAIKSYSPTVTFVQHEYGLFPDARHWLAFLSSLAPLRVFVTLHSVYAHKDKAICEAAIPNIIVHSESGLEALRTKGIRCPVVTIRHGCLPHQPLPALHNLYRSKHTIVMFGFGFKYKNWQHALEVVAILKTKYPDVFLTLIFSLTPFDQGLQQQYLTELRTLIGKLEIGDNCAILSGFVDEQVLEGFLRTNSTGIFPYVSTEGHIVHGASGAARIAMSAGLPIITSKMGHFSDLKGIVPQTANPQESADALTLLFDRSIAKKQITKQNAFLAANSWEVTAQKHVSLFCRKIK